MTINPLFLIKKDFLVKKQIWNDFNYTYWFETDQ